MSDDFPKSLGVRSYELGAMKRWEKSKKKVKRKNPNLYIIYELIEKIRPKLYYEYLIDIVGRKGEEEGCESCYFSGEGSSRDGFVKGEVVIFSMISESNECLFHMFSPHNLSKEDLSIVNEFISIRANSLLID